MIQRCCSQAMNNPEARLHSLQPITFFSLNWLFNSFFHTSASFLPVQRRVFSHTTPLCVQAGRKCFCASVTITRLNFPKTRKTLLSPVACAGIRSIYLSPKTHLEQNFENHISPPLFFRIPRRFSPGGDTHPHTPTRHQPWRK